MNRDDPPSLPAVGTPQWGAGSLGSGPALTEDDPPSLPAVGTPQWGAGSLGAARRSPSSASPSSIVRDGHLVADDWTLVRDADAAVPPEGAVILPLATWVRDPVPLMQRAQTGVWLAPADDPAVLEPWLDGLPLIAIDFPKFTDGRGYSTAFLLRNRLGFRGELRAIGDVLIDQVWAFARVGFNAFALRTDQDVATAVAQLKVFSERYQGSTDQPVPAFRRYARPWPGGTAEGSGK